MKYLSSALVSSILLVNSMQADGFGFSVGPYNLQFGGYGGGATYVVENRSSLDSPICFAISNLNRLEMTVQGTENVSTKEKKIVTKKLIVEPYSFGITREGRPALQGNVIEEKLIREVTVKFGEPQFDEESVDSDKKEKGYFSGLFSSEKSQKIDIRRVTDIEVIRDSHFVPPKNYKSPQNDNVQIICEIPQNEKQ